MSAVLGRVAVVWLTDLRGPLVSMVRAVWIVTVAVALPIGTSAQSSAATTPIRAPIRILGLAALGSEVRESMLDEVEGIYRPGLIEFDWRFDRWLDRQPAARGSSGLEVVIAQRPSKAVIVGCRRRLHDHRLGTTAIGRRRITLWTHQVERAVTGDWDRRVLPPIDPEAHGRALGRVLAHELAHLYLRLYGHHQKGLMRSSFSHRSLASKNGRSFRLSREDLDRIRVAIASRS